MTAKPFDLARAMANGGRCQTRDGRPARIICTDRKGDWPVVALIGETDALLTYQADGRNHPGGETSADLVNIAEKRSGWVNIYAYGDGPQDGRDRYSILYDAEAEANDDAGPNRVACIPIEWEE